MAATRKNAKMLRRASSALHFAVFLVVLNNYKRRIVPAILLCCIGCCTTTDSCREFRMPPVRGYLRMKAQRLNQLEEFIVQRHTVTMEDICSEFRISVTTARRDLNELIAAGGRVEKVYGGVRSTAPTGGASLKGYHKRTGMMTAEKEAICRRAAASIEPGDIIFLDTGTTCTGVLSFLGSVPCTVITNSLAAAELAVPLDLVSLILLPGRLSRNAMALVGSETCDALVKYNIDRAFMTTSGVTIENGLTDTTAEEYTIKRAVLRQSREINLLADSSKFDQKSLYTFCSLDRLSAIYTAGEIDSRYVQYCADHGIALHR